MPPTPLRNIRIDDDLWNAALAKAENEGSNLSEVIREWLETWVKKGDPQ